LLDVSSRNKKYTQRLKKNNSYNFEVSLDKKKSKNFIMTNHYSGTCPNTKYFFNILLKNKIIGSAGLGQVIGRFQSKKYYPENPEKLIELRRLVLIDDTPKNTESWFIAKIIHYLKNNTDYEAILSLADPNFGHNGTIYKASNFRFIGYDGDRRKRIFIDGKEFHPRSLYDIYGTSSVKFLKKEFGNRVELFDKKPKLVYLYRMA
jgi:hypothetical protein